MAIFHMSFSNISAGKGRSAIASAAYRSGEKLFDDKECRHYFYSRHGNGPAPRTGTGRYRLCNMNLSTY